MPEERQMIIRITAEQFKNIRVIDFVPNRYVTKISGANGAGKTSALDVIFYALAPRKTLSPDLIRKGEKKGFIRIETTTHIITRYLDSKGGALEITFKGQQNTQLINPIDYLQRLTGNLGFDPLEFMRVKPQEQFDVLKPLVSLESDIDQLQAENVAAKLTLTRRNAELKQLKGAAAKISVDTTIPAVLVDIDGLLSEARAIGEHNAKIDREQRERTAASRERDQYLRSMNERTHRITEMRAELQRLEKMNDADSAKLEAANAAIAQWPPLPQPQDRHAIDNKISEASATNARVTTNNANRAQYDSLTEQADAIEEEMSTIKKEVTARKLAIGRAFETAKFPVEGLGFQIEEEDDTGREYVNPKKIVTYNGIPLSEASTAEQIRVSAAIGMAGKPDLRFLIIREGSLLDENGWAILEKMAHENDFQILAEVVDTSGKVGVFLQEGEIKAVNTEPEPEPAKPAKKISKKKETAK